MQPSTSLLTFTRRWGLGVGALYGATFSTGAQSQDLGRARATITTLAAPAMHGRGYVTKGEHRAAHYIRQRFRQLGLRSFTPHYTQSFPIAINTFPGRCALAVDGKPLVPGTDFILEPHSGPGHLSGPVTWLDTLVFTDEPDGQRFLDRSLQGQVLVLRHRDAERIRTLPDAFAQHIAQAAAVVTLVPDKLTASLASQQVTQPRLQVLASRWPARAAQASLQVDARLVPNYLTQNLIGYVPGRIQPDSFLVVSAHYDHLGRMGKNTYFPGANDNASGTALLLELADYYARPENQPAYSVVFMAFGAEEAGLLGSNYYVQHPLFPLERLRFLVNLDLEGTGEEGITVVNGRLLEKPFRVLEQLNSQHRYVASIAARGRAANSDHYPFSERNVPAFFLYTRGGSKAYHDVNDQPQQLSLTAFAGVFHLVIDFFAAVAHQ
ncbi:M28 family metallopeptidase [Hymenobacter chitinivorans]|uniref:Peptidase M28-like protein n=1 Tax=Hymenobacter chitinivorans DSM 11115 TaxID=1121954 RepID=A0A2M9B990_9BACT|nr:M28 family peptidase [Hymenobacter chitinivorans]PJJ54501.1 peptidase M28-like protein [Hymenobacter chitinivorans DSM 11115]